MTAKTRAELNSDADTNLANNTRREITPTKVRQRVKDLADSAVLLADFTTRGDIFVRGASTAERLALGASGYALKSDGTDAVWAPSREVLTAARTYYVRTDGSDSNTGLANTSGGAFLTLQKAYNTALTLDCNGYDITIKIADGTYTGALSITKPLVGGNLNINGNASTPDNVVISTTSADAITIAAPMRVHIASLKLQTTTAGSGLNISGGGAYVYGTALSYGACVRAHVAISLGGVFNPLTSEKWSGGGQAHYLLETGGKIQGNTVAATISTTITFSVATVYTATGSVVNFFAFTFSGSAVTATRYTAVTNAVQNTYGGGASYWPGDVAGSTGTGGQYA